jgi:hypothetical protein
VAQNISSQAQLGDCAGRCHRFPKAANVILFDSHVDIAKLVDMATGVWVPGEGIL